VIRIGDSAFREVWLVDFEFSAPPGERPTAVCLVAWELLSGTRPRVWQDELQGMDRPPYAVDRGALFVAYYASAEMGCHLALGWPLPVNVLDLFTEFRNATNGRSLLCGAGLRGALAWYGLQSIGAAEKDSMRLLVQRGGPWSDAEQQALLDYCETDVAALARLLPAIEGTLDVPRALLRGRYMKAAAGIEHNGIPLDVSTLG
jgi:DNA polymerase-1